MANPLEKRASVLLVEDEPLISDIAAEALQEQGFAVHAVASAAEALHCLNSREPIDVLFTDLNLAGGMDGGALAHRARELRPGLPALDPVEGSMFVHKPYDFFDLGRLLDYLVGSNLITGARKAGG